MAIQYVGEIKLFGFNFAPVGWAMCNGQLLPIAQNTALFSLLGTYYGGDGKTTFALPNLQGRVPLHQGSASGPTGGPTSYLVGQVGGSPEVALTKNQLPAHNHLVRADAGPATVTNPAGAFLAQVSTPGYAPPPGTPTSLVPLAHNTVADTGEGEAVSLFQPFLVLTFCIALTGIYPARN
ncbi:MAG TPA: tail fiber protein [Acidimicrobiales bacterium]|nr:tail fiber protein [Acidimicrobiales bacterium]